MLIKPEWFQPILALLAWLRDLTHKQIGARLGIPEHRARYLLTGGQTLAEVQLRNTLPALDARPAHAAAAAGLYETIASLDQDQRFTPEERDAVELWLLGMTRELRETAFEFVLASRQVPPLDEYPKPEDREPARWLARVQLLLLTPLSEEERLAVVGSARRYQHWALAELLADEAARCCSKSLEKAEAWARLAVEVAQRVRGPEGWQSRVRGYAASAGPNVLRVRGRHDEAEAGLEEAKRLWLAGSDPDNILDPGRLLDLEASLRRDQRRFPEALLKANEALAVTRYRGRVLVKRSSIEEAMGDYEVALDTLRVAERYVTRQSDRRLRYQLKFNWAVLSTHLSAFPEAQAIVEEVHDLALSLRDELFLSRVTWLRGRIAAGLDRLADARSLLEQAESEFAGREMWFDVALAHLELVRLLLREGKTAEVKALAPKLAEVFKTRKIHREALAALRTFLDAVEQESATAELAGRVLSFLFRARHDPSLKFES